MYVWLRDRIYQGHSPIGLYWVCFVPLPLIVIAGMILSVKVDLHTNREYEEGRLLRGIRLLRHTRVCSRDEGDYGPRLACTWSRKKVAMRGRLKQPPSRTERAIDSIRKYFGYEERPVWLRMPRAEETEGIMMLG